MEGYNTLISQSHHKPLWIDHQGSFSQKTLRRNVLQTWSHDILFWLHENQILSGRDGILASLFLVEGRRSEEETREPDSGYKFII